MDATPLHRNAGWAGDDASTQTGYARLPCAEYVLGVVRARALPEVSGGSKPVRRSPGFLQRD